MTPTGPAWQKSLPAWAGSILGDLGEIEAEGLKIALMHGTDEPMIRAAVASQIYDAVVRCHNHRVEATRSGKPLLVNHDEIWGYLTDTSSAWPLSG